MKKFRLAFFVLLFLKTSLHVFSQIIVVNTFNTVVLRYEDTWKASVTNLSGAGFAHAELEITKNNQIHLKASSEKFMLQKGANNIDFNSLKIEQIQFSDNNVLWNQFLTFGQFEICLRVYLNESLEKGEGCVPIAILPVSPPTIIAPENEIEICDNQIFSWAPPVPLNIFKNLCYELRIVPVYENQSGYEAMSRNTPVLNEPCLTSLSYIFHVGDLPLEDGKSYAWQVTGKDNGVEVGKSEVQTIKMCNHIKKPKKILVPDYYYKLRKTEDGNFGTAKGCLGFTCEEEQLDSNMNFKVYNNQGVQLTCLDKIKIKKVGEENYFIMILANCNEISTKQTYRLEVLSPTNKKYILYFKYSEPESN